MRNLTSLVFLSVLIVEKLISCDAAKFSVLPNPEVEVSEKEAYLKILDLEKRLKSVTESLIKNVLPYAYRLGSEAELSGECLGTLLKFMTALRDLKLWAVEMLDATAKPNSGMLSGNTVSLGNYQQCLNIEIPDDDKYLRVPPKTGQYCILAIRTPLPPRPDRLKFFGQVFQKINATFETQLMNYFRENLFGMYDLPAKLGLCVPSTCSMEDLTKIATLAGKELGINAEMESCELPEKMQLDQVQIIVICGLSAFAIACLVSTIVVEIHDCNREPDAHVHKNKSWAYRMILSFSVLSNFKRFMRTTPSKPFSLDSTMGLKYMSTWMVILLHAYTIFDTNLIGNPYNYKAMTKGVLHITVMGTLMSVETFFFITATLMSYKIVQTYDASGIYDPFVRVLRRIWRLLPALLIVTAVGFLLPLLASGPEYKFFIEDKVESCKVNWWKNILFVGNFVAPNKMCLPHSWYVSVDIQLFLVGIVYYALLFKKRILGTAFLALLLAGSVLSTGIITYIFQYPPVTQAQYVDYSLVFQFFKNIYLQPSTHLGSYAVGLFLGTHLARHPKIKLATLTSLIGWVLATSVGVTVAIFPWGSGLSWTMLEAAIFAAFQRPVWSLYVAWIVFVCFIGKGGHVNTLLSWRGFQPLLKVSYMIYLIHFEVLQVYTYSRQGPLYLSHSTFIYNFFGTLCVSHILAFVLYIFFEAPLLELESVFWAWYRGEFRKTACVKDMDKDKLSSRL